jgi:hypothetical protein
MASRQIAATGTQTVSAVVRAQGEQHTDVRGYVHGGPGDAAYVVVTAGSTLTYCYDLDAVASHARAWALTKSRPTHWLPQTHEIEREPQPEALVRVAVSVSARGPQPYEARMVAARVTLDRRAHLAVIVGRTTVVVYDRTALAAYVDAWSNALDYARRIFGDPDPDAFTLLAEQERRREERRIERTGKR